MYQQEKPTHSIFFSPQGGNLAADAESEKSEASNKPGSGDYVSHVTLTITLISVPSHLTGDVKEPLRTTCSPVTTLNASVSSIWGHLNP